MKSSITFFTLIIGASSAFAVPTMTIKRDCTVKKISSAASNSAIAVGERAVITTTTNQDFEKPEVVKGTNSILFEKEKIVGSSGRFTYDAKSPTGSTYEIIGSGSSVIVRDTLMSAYTGKLTSHIYVNNKKVAELQCITPNE